MSFRFKNQSFHVKVFDAKTVLILLHGMTPRGMDNNCASTN